MLSTLHTEIRRSVKYLFLTKSLLWWSHWVKSIIRWYTIRKMKRKTGFIRVNLVTSIVRCSYKKKFTIVSIHSWPQPFNVLQASVETYKHIIEFTTDRDQLNTNTAWKSCLSPYFHNETSYFRSFARSKPSEV